MSGYGKSDETKAKDAKLAKSLRVRLGLAEIHEWDYIENDLLLAARGFVAVLVGVFAAVFLCVSAITAYSFHLDEAKCFKLAEVSGRETRWVEYNFWDRQCLVRSVNGKWIPMDDVSKLEVETEAGK